MRASRDNHSFEKGYQQFTAKAKNYLNNRHKAAELLHQVIEKAKKNEGIIGESVKTLELLVEMFRDWVKGDYRHVPTRSLITIVAVLLYFVSFADMIPDFLIGIGLVDDIAVLGYAMKQIQKDLDDYKAWQEERSGYSEFSIGAYGNPT